MRKDGTITVFQIEHRVDESGRGGDRWARSDLAHFLFANLSYAESKEKGDHLRMLIQAAKPYEVWNEWDVQGTKSLEDAMDCMIAISRANPGRAFRVVERTFSQETKVRFIAGAV